MNYLIGCSDPAGVPSIDVLGSVVCSAGVPALSGAGAYLADLSAADVNALMAQAMVVIVMAWGFRVVGRLLFKGGA